MDTLLKAKHWQIFLFAFGIPWLLMFIVLGFTMVDFVSMLKANPDPQDVAIIMTDFMSQIMIGIMPLALLSVAVTYSWMYAINKRIAPMAPIAYQPKERLVSMAIISIVIFTILNFVVSAYMYTSGLAEIFNFENNPAEIPSMGPKFLILQVLSIMFSFVNFGLSIYVCYQLSRALKGAELQRHLRSDDIIGPILAFVFLFIGIWFMQPIVNELHAKGPGGGNSLDNSLLLH